MQRTNGSQPNPLVRMQRHPRLVTGIGRIFVMLDELWVGQKGNPQRGALGEAGPLLQLGVKANRPGQSY